MAFINLFPDGLMGLEEGAAIVLITTATLIYFSAEHQVRLKKLVFDKIFLLATVPIVIWTYITLQLPDEGKYRRVRESTKDALVAFVIAILAYLELKAAPFWIIWLMSYYLNVKG